jgi:hypothetical protein
MHFRAQQPSQAPLDPRGGDARRFNIAGSWERIANKRCSLFVEFLATMDRMEEASREERIHLGSTPFFRFSRSQTGGNRSDRLISLEGGVQSGVHGVGKVCYGVGGRNWGNFNWENLPARLSLSAFAKRVAGEALAAQKQIWPTLGK